MTRISIAVKSWIFGPCLLLSLPMSGQDRKKSDPRLTADDKPKARDILFPNWPPDAFDFSLGPIIGGRARQTEHAGIKYDSISSEIGLGGRVHGIPLIPFNPGITIEPYASYTWGNRTQKAKGAALDKTDSTGFQRHWYGAMARFYFEAFRYSLDLGQGRINYDDNQFEDIRSTRFMNDFGVLVLPFLSGHYTLTSLAVHEGNDSEASIKELDHWLHAQMAFSLLSFSLDFGPGRTQTKYSGRLTPEGALESIGTVNTSYLKALTSLNLFWKLGASGSAKYIISADKTEALETGIEQLPYAGLNENKSLAILPKGSLEAAAFFGIRNFMAGFGVGWQFYYLELSSDRQEKQISRDQGLVVSYEARL